MYNKAAPVMITAVAVAPRRRVVIVLVQTQYIIPRALLWFYEALAGDLYFSE
jgi:hypothetical protein